MEKQLRDKGVQWTLQKKNKLLYHATYWYIVVLCYQINREDNKLT